MSFFPQPLQLLFAVLCESIRQEQEQEKVDGKYLQLENQVLREQVGGKRVLVAGS